MRELESNQKRVGAQNTIRRIIDEFSCPLADFEKVKKKGRFRIQLRNGK